MCFHVSFHVLMGYPATDAELENFKPQDATIIANMHMKFFGQSIVVSLQTVGFNHVRVHYVGIKYIDRPQRNNL